MDWDRGREPVAALLPRTVTRRHREYAEATSSAGSGGLHVAHRDRPGRVGEGPHNFDHHILAPVSCSMRAPSGSEAVPRGLSRSAANKVEASAQTANNVCAFFILPPTVPGNRRCRDPYVAEPCRLSGFPNKQRNFDGSHPLLPSWSKKVSGG